MQRPLALGVVVLALGLAAPGHAQRPLTIHLENGDYTCRAGDSLLTQQEARSQLQRICQQLPQWAIARLAGGASMDGPGYGCTVHPYDQRSLGHSLCVVTAQMRVPPGRFQATHPRWTDTFELQPGGRLTTSRFGPGSWSIEGQELVLRVTRRRGRARREWRLSRVRPGQFQSRNGRLTLQRQVAAPPPSYLDPQAVLGTFQLRGRRGRAQLTLFANGTYQGPQGLGHWHTEGMVLVLQGPRGAMRFRYRPGDSTFREIGGRGRVLAPLGGPPSVQPPPPVAPAPPPPAFAPAAVVGSYQAVHPQWQDRMILDAGGTFRRAGGDRGTWRIEGSALVLQWSNGAVSRLQRLADGSFRGASGLTLRPMVRRRSGGGGGTVVRPR